MLDVAELLQVNAKMKEDLKDVIEQNINLQHELGRHEAITKELDDLEDQLYLLEEVPDEDLWEDGELKKDEVFDKINYHLFVEGDWKLMRRKTNEL
tara:strand:+ start:16642 stop:16929 length:288 start_codon:yes stop_codon:yes gene_type:complete